MLHAIDEFIKDLENIHEELDECADLEDKLKIAKEIDRTKKLRNSRKDIIFFECGLCQGYGHNEFYDDKWICPYCYGQGGKWIEKIKIPIKD